MSEAGEAAPVGLIVRYSNYIDATVLIGYLNSRYPLLFTKWNTVEALFATALVSDQALVRPAL